MILVSIISFCVAAFLILEAVFWKSDFFSPARIYLFFHSLALGIAFLAFDKAMVPFKPFTSLVYFGSATCFLLGVWMVNRMDGITHGGVPEPRALDFEHYNWKMHLVFSLAVFAFFIWGTMGLYQGGAEIPLFAEDKGKALYRLFLNKKWLFIYGYTYAGIVMALFFMYIFRPSRLPKIFNPGFWMTVVTASVFSLALQRSALMFFVFFAVIFYHNGIRRLSMWKLFRFFFICLILILITGYFKQGELEHQRIVKPAKVIQTILKIPYFYVANNFWNLDYALNPENFQERQPTTYGLDALQGILDGIPLPGGTLSGQIRRDTHIDDQFNLHATKVKGWNTIGYQWSLYKDFGLMGVFLGPLIIGATIAMLYLNMRRNTTMLSLAIYSYVAYWIANSYFGSIFEAPTYTWGFIYVCLCCYLSQTIFSRKLSSLSVMTGSPRLETGSDDIPAMS